MEKPIPDHTGWQITPTLHKTVTDSTDPLKTPLPHPFAVCVIGASRGIGAHIAYAYAKAGASSLVLAARDGPALEQVAEEVKGNAQRKDIQVLTSICDISSDAAVSQLGEKIKTEVGRLDVVIVNAGMWGELAIRVTEGSTKQFQDIIDVDLVGAYLAAHYLIPILIGSEAGAKAFIAISGTGAWVTSGPVAHTAHSIGKLAQTRLVEHIANDFQEEGLLAVAVHPGCVLTNFSKKLPEIVHPYLTDDPGLCGGFLVWLTKPNQDRLWLSGRFLSATWNVDELVGMKEAIVKSDMLKIRMHVT